MKNKITLSLITASVLGLSGCGGTGTISTDPEVNATKKTASDLIDQKGSSDIDNKEKLVTAVGGAIETNIKSLKDNLLNDLEANDRSVAFVGTALSGIKLDELANQVNIECGEEQPCIDEAYASLSAPLTMDKEEAYAAAQEVRGDEKGLVNDKLVKDFTCKAGLTRTVKHYGVEDVFSTTNGIEQTYQNPASITQDMINYNTNVGAGFANYDEPNYNRLFLDSITGLPQNIVSGRIYIGLKSNGELQANDTLSLGDLSQPYGTQRYAKALTDLSTDGWSNQQVSQTNPTTDIYWNDFNTITMGSQTLLDYVRTNNSFDAYVQDDTSVDFITVATCSKPDPIQEIEAVVNKFECSEKEGKIFQVRGGTLDAFNPSSDQATVVSNDFLNRANPYAVAQYDATNYDKHLLDTLTLPTGNITKAQFVIGYKPLRATALFTNDTIHIGKYGSQHAGGRYVLYPIQPNPNPEAHFWQRYSISGETVSTVNLADINTSAGMPMINWIQGKSDFEIRVEDDTSVDFTQLNLCVKEKL